MDKPCAVWGKVEEYTPTMTTMLLTASSAVVRASPKRTKPPAARRPLPRAEHAEDPGSWRYRPHKGNRKYRLLAMIVAAGAHVTAFYGYRGDTGPELIAQDLEELPAILLEMPPLEELDEPEEVFDGDAPTEEIDPGSYVPMQADIPVFNTDATFVQKMDFQSLLPKPEFDSAVLSIPKRISHTRVDPSRMKDLFELADLDRIPEAIFQPPPVFPLNLRKEVYFAEVMVEFIVDVKGKVPWAKVIETTHRGFEDAAVLGVSRWQFRPGMKGGKRVNARMRVPLRFRITDD